MQRSAHGNAAMDMDEFLDGEIGENSKLLSDLLRGLKKKESLLQGQVHDSIVARSSHILYTYMYMYMKVVYVVYEYSLKVSNWSRSNILTNVIMTPFYFVAVWD